MRRSACIAVIALLGALVPAAAAFAAPAPTLTMDSVSLVPGGVTKLIRASLTAAPGNPIAQAEVVFDIAAASKIATIKPYGDCTATATTITCRGAAADVFESPMDLTAKPDAELGASATIPVRALVGGATVASATGKVTIAEGVDLAAVDLLDDVTVASGATVGLASGVRNVGDKPVRGAYLLVHKYLGVVAKKYRNCVGDGQEYYCRFDGELAPGGEYRLAAPLEVTATEATWAPSQWGGSLTWVTPQDYSGPSIPAGGAGPSLTLTLVEARAEAPQTDDNPYNNFDFFTITVTGSNRSNITAVGARASAEVGDQITVRVKARNNGPARLEGYGAAQGSYLTVGVTPPAGTTVVKAAALCQTFNLDNVPTPPWPPDARFDDGNYYCFNHDIFLSPYAAGETATWQFTLRIDKPGTLRGEIFTQVIGPAGAPKGDPNPADDKAAIVITASGGEAGGDGGDGGGLPITGTDVPAVVLIGLVLLLAGAGARMAARRR